MRSDGKGHQQSCWEKLQKILQSARALNFHVTLEAVVVVVGHQLSFILQIVCRPPWESRRPSHAHDCRERLEPALTLGARHSLLHGPQRLVEASGGRG